MRRTDQFRKQHEGIVALVGEISNSLDSSTVANNAQDVRLTLSKLAGLVKLHLSMEDKSLYPALLDSPDPKVKATAKQFMDEMGHIAEAFGQYNTKWTSQAMRENPDAFVRETRALFGALGKRIERENTQLYPLADLER